MEFEAGPSKKARKSGTGLAELAARLTKLLAHDNVHRNVVYSPLSIYAALALLAPGARGDTLDEILRVLGARSRDELEDFISSVTAEALQDRSGSGGPSVAFARGVWSDSTRPLKPAYRDAVVGAYKAEGRAVDFRRDTKEAARQINAWFAEVTGNLIGDIITPGSMAPAAATDVVLANAMYFKGKWKNLPFHERHTTNKPFHRLAAGAAGAADVPFMTSSRRHFIAVHDGFKVLKLQYKMPPDVSHFRRPTQYSMCIFLPDARDGLWSLVGEITSRPSFVHEHLPLRQVTVGQFRVPNLKLSFSSNITQILRYLGLLLPFSMEADLTGMVEDDGSGLPLLVNDVFHKAVIEVNEEGTEAPAVTVFGAVGCAMMMPTPLVDFVADHPFAYFIIEETSGAIVFAGHVVDPSNGLQPGADWMTVDDTREFVMGSGNLPMPRF